MSLNIWVFLLVDRIHINVGIVAADLYGFVVAQLKGMEDIQGKLVPDGKIIVTENYSWTRMDYYPTKTKKIAEVWVGTTKTKHRYFKLVLYPSKFKQGQFEHFKWVLDMLLPDFKYQKLFDTGRVSYIELAIDSLTHAAHSFIPFRAMSNKSSIFVEKTGVKGSTYVGSSLSKLWFCIYDKHKHQIDKSYAAIEPLRTRIESRSRHIGLSPCNLQEKMVNPFLKLEIASLKKARDASKDKLWQGFLDLCLIDGSAAALAHQTKYKRTQYLKMLRAAAVPWWNPQGVWPELPRALKVIAP